MEQKVSSKGGEMKEKLTMWIVWHLPRCMIVWAAIRLMAHATTGEYAHQDTSAITFADALNRWNAK